MWSKYVTRRLAVQVAQAWNFGWGEAMEAVYGVSVNNTLVLRDSKKTDYYVDTAEHEAYVQGLYTLLTKQDFLTSFHADAQRTIESILAAVTTQCSQDLSALSHQELCTLYRDVILPNQAQFYIRMWTVFNIGEPIAHTMEQHIRRYVFDDTAVNKYLLMFSTPLLPNDVLNERMSLLTIAVEKDALSPQALDERLLAHTARFRHIPMFDFDHEPYTTDYFQSALMDIDPSHARTELVELSAQFKEHAKEYEQALATLDPDASFRALAQFLKENVFLRDYRDMIRQKLNLVLRTLYTAIGDRFGLTVPEVAVLTNDEIIEHLSAGTLFPREEVAKRAEAYLLIQHGSEAHIYSGSEAIEKAEQEPGVVVGSYDGVQVVRGVVGSKGKASGRAKIVFTNKDLGKVEKGDVLVATMTRQDFVPAMRRAVAIVTDEGSVTAHAAIIARELGIPCIVAAKIATHVFKDGDVVEVDADRGIVKKIL